MSFGRKAGRRRTRARIAAEAVVVATGVLIASPANAAPLQQPTDATAVEQAVLRARVEAVLDAQTSTSGATIAPKIIGGSDTTIDQAPWMAQLWYTDSRGTFFCGGTVVSPTKIVTAAHCVAGLDWHNNGFIVTGTGQLPTRSGLTGDPDLHGGTLSGVWRQWNHPSYNVTTIDNDVAVLTLTTPVTAPALPVTTSADTASYGTGTQATVFGWGRTSSTSNDISPTLRTATLPIAADADCTAFYGSEFITGHMVCAGTPASGQDSGTTGICNGDSGGPLIVGGKLVGIVSWATQDCVYKGSYSGFAKVSTYADAIAPRIADSDYAAAAGAALFARTPAGTGYAYSATTGQLQPRRAVGDWTGLNLVRQTDLDHDGVADLIARTPAGTLFWTHPTAGGGAWSVERIGGGWQYMKAIDLAGDLTGDGVPDLVAADGGGTLWLYPGQTGGRFGSRVQVGGGWQTYNGSLYGKGDLTGDGRADLLARDASGYLWLYSGTGSATRPFDHRVQVGGGWNYTAYSATGDVTGDGRADLYARDASGTLYFYRGTGSAARPFERRVVQGPGWNGYNLFG